MAASNSVCAVLVPVYSHPTAKCEEGLRELAKAGYPVRCVRGFSAIDQGRNQLASDALHDGFEETMWIDPDIGFDVDAVNRLRSHAFPLSAGVCPMPASKSLSCELLPNARELVLGKDADAVEVNYATCGFLHVRREVYHQIRERLQLPLCNTRFGGRGIWPFFQPCTIEINTTTTELDRRPTGTPPRYRYLTDDFAFCHRAKEVGFQIMVDASIRLWRVASYGYSWEDAGQDPERFDTYRYRIE